ncbi:hypothetical protein NW761_006189 [Fusarium oxysporum]|nr:hypothetical protein NW758_009306 [Fusarium oxysporum]KAJ4049028.1 hypothetical protein NW753_008027 [Fusarium oxysporum]KAJ4049611.1 hypothetical protein NW763_008909 [Fusarium oxysporum]KAJ4089906.1 hypothetical protein NW756_006242 [Fusarium oxysporum]KAJ4091976.1 hypothetical protein NW761_006189 [Fusarium oxysporum]
MSIHAREGIGSSHWQGRRTTAVKLLTVVAVAILLVFLADLSYLFGATFQVKDRVQALKILVVDYDGGPVGQSVAQAYRSLQSNQFPSFDFRSSADFPDPSNIKHEVCKDKYWGAVYIQNGASDRLANLYKGGAAAEGNNNNNSTEAVTYTYNAARYPTVASSYLAPNFQALISASREMYYQTDEGSSALRSLNTSDPTAVQTYLSPITSTADVIRPTNQGSRSLYNTINIVMAVLGQFFFVIAMNGIFDKFGIHNKMRVRDVWIMRFTAGKIFSLLYAIVVTGYIWAFREDWGVDGRAWALTWLTFWLFMDTNFQVLESLIGSYMSLQFTPFFLLSWFMVNVAACVFPFELLAGFYRVGYVFPAHAMWVILIEVWSGCGNSMHIGLPVLFAWWTVGQVTAFFSIRKHCLDSVVVM